MRRILLSAAMVIAVGAMTGARADEPDYVESRAADGTRVIRAKAIVVHGEPVKPRAVYVLKRAEVRYETESAEQTFLPRILEATGRHPF